MKYLIIIPDGGADLPLDELDGLTPFQAANTPNLDRFTKSGRLGTVATTPVGFDAGSDVCTMSLLGYDPARYHNGRAPLEAASMGIKSNAVEWIFRANLVSVGEIGSEQEGLMLDHSAGGITDAEAHELLTGLSQYWNSHAPDIACDLDLAPGVSYRSILVDRSRRDYASTETIPPHEFPNQPFAPSLPSASTEESQTLRTLMQLSHEYLDQHEINIARREQGLRPANMTWIWGQGTKPQLPQFIDRFALRGAMITSVDLLSGIAKLIGWDLIDCPGLTSYHDTDYDAQARATISALQSYDIVCSHIEAPDEASHQSDFVTKVASLEAIDRKILGPILRWIDSSEESVRVLVLPDHYTLCSNRKHDATPVPFAMGGPWISSLVERSFSELNANASDLHIQKGHELMEYFLRSGLPRTSK